VLKFAREVSFVDFASGARERSVTNSVSGRSRTGLGEGFVGKHGRVMEVYLSSFTLLYISMCCAVVSVTTVGSIIKPARQLTPYVSSVAS
jgi:hypothetical protein